MNLKQFVRNILTKLITYFAFLLSKILFWKAKRRIWLIACGGDRWGDNADAFWRYMNDQHPEIKTIAVIKNNTILDTEKNNWVKRNKLSSYILVLRAEAMATTHTLSDIGPERLNSLSRAKKVWLQHGVVGIGKITAEKARAGIYDMICVSSRKEKELMEQDLGIDSNLLIITGLARHDVLKDEAKKNLDRKGILYIPTSRVWLDQNQKAEYEAMLFSWVEKLYSRDISISVKIWLHPGWYKSGLDDLGLKYNKVDHYKLDIDPQQLILESRLLITDYSSVFFDAALSGMPTIFFQPDKASYLKNKGLFKDFLEQSLLLIVDNEEELIVQIEKIINDTSYYRQRLEKDQEWAHQYVETYDGNSCQRIYQHIEQMLK